VLNTLDSLGRQIAKMMRQNVGENTGLPVPFRTLPPLLTNYATGRISITQHAPTLHGRLAVRLTQYPGRRLECAMAVTSTLGSATVKTMIYGNRRST
jgi:hypothetical protein